MARPVLDRVVPYAIALAACVAALLLKVALSAGILTGLFVPFYGAVLLSAWYGGFGPGVAATALSIAVVAVRLLPPASGAIDFLRVGLFAALALVTTAVIAVQRRNRRALEQRIRARTDEIGRINAALQQQVAQARRTEETLRQSEERYAIAVAGANDGLWDWYLDTNSFYFSPRALELLGFENTPADAYVSRWEQRLHPDDKERVLTELRAHIDGHTPYYRSEHRIQQPDGSYRWLLARAALVRGSAGEVARMAGWLTDISARKEAEQALRESEQRFHNAFQFAPIGMALVGLDGRPLQVNPALAAMLGYTPAELLTKPVLEVTHPDDRAAAERDRDRLLAGTVGSYQAERRYRHRLGHTVWAQLSVSVVRGLQGEPLYIVTQLADITSRKRAEQALQRAHEELETRVAQRTAELSAANALLHDEITQRRRAEMRYRTLVEQLPATTYIVAHDAALLPVYVSPQITQTLGFAPEEWLADPQLRVRQLHPADRKRVLATVARCVESGDPWTLEYRMVAKDGRLVWLRDQALAVRDEEGRALFTQGVVLDITEHKLAEEQLHELNDRLANLLESLSDGFLVLDQRGCFTYLNPRAAELLRRAPQELLGRQIWDVFPEGVDSPFFKQYQQVMSERVAVTTQAYDPRLNRWFAARAYPSQDGMSVLVEDVTERHTREVTTLSDILRALNAAPNVSAALPQVAASLRALTGCHHCGLSLFDESGEWFQQLTLDAQWTRALNGTRVRLSESPAAAEIIAGKPYFVPDLRTELEFPIARQLHAAGLRSRLSLPLRGRQQLLGMLTLSWRRLAGFDTADVPFLSQIADAVALAVEKDRLFEEVRDGRERLQALSHRLLEVQEGERQHIARELHDEIGQGLTGLKLALDAGGRLPAERFGDMQRVVDELLLRVRNLSLDLRPGMLDDLGLLPALLWLFGRYGSQTNVRVLFEHRGLARRFPPEIETTAYRIVQEALTNVARHAAVDEVTVQVWVDRETLRLQVSDHGNGFDVDRALAAGTSSGLSGMRERTLLLGGQFRLESESRTGTCLSADLPFANANEDTVHAHQDRLG